MTTTKAKVTTITFGQLSFKGLMLPNGDFAIAASQAAEMFSLVKSNATKQLKALLGKESPLVKVSSELNSNKVSILSLTEFEKVLVKLDRKGNKQAQDFRDDLIGLKLHELWCEAFNIRFEQEERQAWIKERQKGKWYRRTLTDAIKYLKDQGVKIESLTLL